MANQQFQGPVPLGSDVKRFRETGETAPINNSKEKSRKQKKSFKKLKKIKAKRILKKPTVKGPVPISARKTLKGFAQSVDTVVREVEQIEPVQDNRSQFFKEEFQKEERGINKWLS